MHQNIKIRVQILGEHGSVLRDAALEVGMAREAMRTLDYPSKDCDATTAAIFCTPVTERIETEDFRKELARVLSAEFVAFFAQNDTEMGYPKRA